MATRRSARLRGETPVTELPLKKITRSRTKLEPVIERDNHDHENKYSRQTPDPATPKATQSSRHSITPKTPSSRDLLTPALEDMHPSKFQQSTAKQPDTGLLLGFRPIQGNSAGTKQSIADTPSKSKGKLSDVDELRDMNFDFKFSSGDLQLSSEAKKLMDNIREEAARIKAQMVIDQAARNREDEQAEKRPLARKIARATSVAGRFSEAHMAQFRKMDSIAGHPSSFRTRPVNPQVSPIKSLKRTSSVAQLDQPEQPSPMKAKLLRPSVANVDRGSVTRLPLSSSMQFGNKATPQAAQLSPSKFSTPRKPTIPRSSSVKHIRLGRSSPVPRSPSAKAGLHIRTPQTDIRTSNKTTNLTGLKSILRRRQPLFSKDPAKIAAGTHQAPPVGDFESKLLGLPDTFDRNTNRSIQKRVDFSASTKLRDACNEMSPSASKIAQPKHSGEVVYPSLPSITPPHERQEPGFRFSFESSTIRKIASPTKPSQASTISLHSPIAHGITNKKRHRDEIDEEPQTPSNNRIVKRIKTNSVTPTIVKTPSPVKRRLPPKSTPRRGGAPGSVTQKGKGLSISRLNFLATPKTRS
ncbi:hypothetical protein FQN57_007143 [Myotisia sp. PD_48]|nr:hypothetical protein FQN57_007143 [Myotisia sp. PD_48]